MSTRQKSFFDQGNNKKVCVLHDSEFSFTVLLMIQPRPYWQRNSKPDDVHRRDDSYNKPKMVATPIAASAATKSKLKAFHFAEDSKTPAVCDESIRKRDPSDKENQVTTRGHTSAPGSQVDISNQPSTQSATPKARKDCPQTPLSRLPLADLIGSTEDPLNRAGLEVTPDERVYWNHSPHSSDQMSSSATPATRRGKKRARSSSPASASQNEVSSHFATKKNLDPLQKSLKTPQADPATDLWNRYAINAGNLQDGPPLPAFAHLIHSPSPHSAGNDGSVLRRSLSGGFEFGASKAKRRRINSGARDGNGHDMLRVQAEDGHDGQESLKMSRVGSLVERIQATLKSRNVTHAAAPSSSSPLPETGGDDMIPPLSPLRRALMADQRAAEGHPGESDVADETHNYEPSDDAVVPPKSLDSSSDYDDDEIDLEMLLNAENPSEARLATGTMHSQLNTAAVEPKRKPANLPGTGSQTSGAAKHNYVGVRIAENDVLNPVHEQDDFDEFEDNYDELAADLEDVVAMYDTQAPSQSKQVEASSENRDYPQVSAQASADQPALKDTTVLSGNAEVFNDGELESEDEFGDDIDFEQLAVQFTPAPGPQTLTPSRSAVCSRFLNPST